MAASTSVTSPSDPLLSWTTHGDQLSAVASGVWTCANADRLERLTDSLDRQPASTVTLDISGVGEIDTFGGWLIERAVRQANSRKQTMQLAAVPDRYRDLLATLDRTTARLRRRRPRAAYSRLGWRRSARESRRSAMTLSPSSQCSAP